MSKVWYKWPENYYDKPWRPWYGIVKMVSLLPFVVGSFALFYLFVALAGGLDEAERIRKDIF